MFTRSHVSSSLTRYVRIGLPLLLALSVLGSPLFAEFDEVNAKRNYGGPVDRELAGQPPESSQTPQDPPFTASIDNQRTLHIEATNATETIIAEVNGDPASISIEYRLTAGAPPQKSSFRLDAFDTLVLNARGGADFVNIIDAAELLTARRKVLKLDGGSGENIVVLTHRPFNPQTARQMMELLNLSKQSEELAKRASEAVSQALSNDAMSLVESYRVDLTEASKSLIADAEDQLFGPAGKLAERSEKELIELGDSLTARSDALAKLQDEFVADMTKKYDASNGVSAPDDNSETSDATSGKPDADLASPGVEEREAQSAQAQADRLSEIAMKLSADAKTRVELMRSQMEIDASGIDRRGAGIKSRAEQLSTTAEHLGARGEVDLSAAAERVVAAVAELNSMRSNFEAAGMAVREELETAVAKTVVTQQGEAGSALGAACNSPISTTHTYSGSGFFFPFSAASSSWSITGGAFTDLLIGGSAADDIHGGAGTDFILGRGGNDHIHGDDGNDFLVGEWLIDSLSITGNDCIWGDNGVDIVIGDNVIGSTTGTPGGDDELSGGTGIDIVIGDDALLDILSQNLPGGKDTLEGNEDIDILFGCGGVDNIKGNDDMDFAEGNGGADVIDGGDGRNFAFCNTTVQLGNLLLGGNDGDTVTGGAGIDIILGNEGADTLTGKDQVDFMFGGSGKDKMFGDTGGTICIISGIPIRLGNLMLGGTEEDDMRAGGDLDVMLGQDEDDELRGYDGSFQQPFAFDIDILLGGSGKDFLQGDNEPLILLFSLDFMFGGSGNDDMHGGNNTDFMFGQSGEDSMHGDSNLFINIFSIDLMFGGPDNDLMDGGNSLDVMFGEGENDTMLGDNEAVLFSPDFMFGQSGADAMNGGSSFDVMVGGDDADNMLGDSNLLLQPFSIDFMFGGPGPDFMDGGNALDLMSGGPDNDTMLGDNSTPVRLSLDFMLGDSGNDDMDGGNTVDFMWGGIGNDKMVGDKQLSFQLLSLDVMSGDEGCDTMLGGRAFDIMSGGPGVDQMEGQLGPDLMFGNANSDTINGGDSLDVIEGNDGNDLIHGNGFIDVIGGNQGDDCLYGDDGIDVIAGNQGNDCIHGDNGWDQLFGNDGNDLIFGDNGFDRLRGGNGNDKLDGGNGPDILIGDAGSDELWGGPGPDLLSGEIKHQAGSSGLNCNCQLEVCPIPPVVTLKADKCVATTSEPHTMPDSSNGGTPQVTIGEIIRYRLTVTLPEGISTFVSLVDHLPPGLTYLGNPRVAFVSTGGSGVITSSVPALSGSGLNLSASGVGTCSGPTPVFVLPISQVSGGPFGSGVDPIFTLGSLNNSHNDPNLEYVIVEFNALVNNLPTNAPGLPNQNGATLSNSYDVFVGGTQLPTAASNPSNVAIVEPHLDVTKTVSPVTPTNTATFTVTLKNTGTAAAFDVEMKDVLPAGLVLTTPAPSVNVAPANCSQPSLTTTGNNTLTLTAPQIPVGCTVTLTFTVNVSATCNPPANTVQVSYTSLPGGPGGPNSPVGTQPNNTGSVTPGSTGALNGDRLYTASAQASIPGVACKPSCGCPLKISRFRTNGPAGPADEFVEIFNSGDSPVTVSSCSDDPATSANGIGVFVSAGQGVHPQFGQAANISSLACQIPGSTVIPGRSSFLCYGTEYSLKDKGTNGVSQHAAGSMKIGSGTASAGTNDIPDDAGLALLSLGSSTVTQCVIGSLGCPCGFNYADPGGGGTGSAVVLDKVGFNPYGPGSPANTGPGLYPANIYPSLAAQYCEGTLIPSSPGGPTNVATNLGCLQPVGDASVITLGPGGVCPGAIGPPSAPTAFPVFPGGTIGTVPVCYGESGQYEILRRQTTFDPLRGTLHTDTDNNGNDFILVSPNPASSNVGLGLTGILNVTSVLGAAGAFDTTAPPDMPSIKFPQTVSNVAVNFGSPPDVLNPANAPLGTLTVRLTYTNLSGAPITGLRFKVDNLATLCGNQTSPNSTLSLPATGNARNLSILPTCSASVNSAILKVLNSQTATVTINGSPVTFLGTVLEDLSQASPAQGALSPFGGGVDSSLIIIDAAQPTIGDGVTGGKGIFGIGLPIGGTVRVQFRFGIVRGGAYNILISPMVRN